MKTWEVYAVFPEVLAKHTFQTARVEAGGFDTAAARALREIRKREGIKGKRISKLKLSLVAVDTAAEQEL